MGIVEFIFGLSLGGMLGVLAMGLFSIHQMKEIERVDFEVFDKEDNDPE